MALVGGVGKLMNLSHHIRIVVAAPREPCRAKCTAFHHSHFTINPLKQGYALTPRGGPNLGKLLVCSLSCCRALVCSLRNTTSPYRTSKGPPGPIGGRGYPATSLARQEGGLPART